MPLRNMYQCKYSRNAMCDHARQCKDCDVYFTSDLFYQKGGRDNLSVASSSNKKTASLTKKVITL